MMADSDTTMIFFVTTFFFVCVCVYVCVTTLCKYGHYYVLNLGIVIWPIDEIKVIIKVFGYYFLF